MDTFMDAVQTIVNEHKEAEAIRILAKAMSEDMEQIRLEAAEAKAGMRIIHKINRGKDKCIDNICRGY